ncbi:MAG: site-2 protease family protein [Candidatus Altiarchaeota archaeon]|nr:site-2 protease family protein [Candidatus Altiarchaeota archaeon]
MIEFGLALVFLFFLLAFVFLVRSDHQRYFGVVFMIRSHYGIKVIDSLSRFYPGFWKFIADLSVLLSFGGLGGYYLSSHRESRDNLYKSILVLGLLSCVPVYFIKGGLYSFAAFLASFAAYMILSRFKNPFIDFIGASCLFSAFSSVFLSAFSSLRLDGFFASVFLGVFGLPSILIYGLFSHGLNILSAESNMPGVSPMVPTSRDGNVGVGFPGYDLFIPWWHALLALFVTLVVHEGAHGVLVRVAKVKLKSTGILSLFSIPVGAFVEPDEEGLNRKSSVSRMRVFSMGSFANIATGLVGVVLILSLALASRTIMSSNGFRVVGHISGLGAEENLPDGTVIYSFNGVSASDVEAYKNATLGVKPGERVLLNTSAGLLDVVLKQNPEDVSRGYIGVYLVEDISIKPEYAGFVSIGLLQYLFEALGWVIFFNINIGLVNLLPVVPFDGGRMFKEFAETLRLSELNVNRVLYAVLGLTSVLLLVNMLPLFGIVADYIISRL